MWRSLRSWCARAWPWIAGAFASLAALLTAGLMRRKSAAVQRRQKAQADSARAEATALAAIQARAEAQRDALLRLADQIESEAREEEQLDEALQQELLSLRDRVKAMSTEELVAESQEQARRYRLRQGGALLVLWCALAPALALAEPACVPRDVLETLVIATASEARVSALEARLGTLSEQLTIVRLASDSATTAAEAASARLARAADALALARQQAQEAAQTSRRRTILAASGAALGSLLATLAIVWVVR